MHTRDTPFSLARCAISITVSLFNNACGVISVS
jgi:hypothetical protein